MVYVNSLIFRGGHIRYRFDRSCAMGAAIVPQYQPCQSLSVDYINPATTLNKGKS